MARNKEGKQPLCPLEYGLDIFNGKWKTRIICLLGASGTLRYKEIRDNLDGLTDAVLAATLRDMVNDRIVDRRQYNEIPPRVEYSLSEKGASAHKILRSICCWAVRYCPLPEESLPPAKRSGAALCKKTGAVSRPFPHLPVSGLLLKDVFVLPPSLQAPAEIPREIEVAFHIHVLGPRRAAADAAEAGKAARAVDAAMVGRDGLHRAQGGAQAAVRTGLGGQRHEAHAPALSPVRTLPLDGQRHGRGKIALPGCQQLLHEAAVLG